jgi:uncharacterized membrane protein
MALGGAGFIVGLFAPPLLVATAVGAIIGAGVGKIAQRKVESGIEKQAEETIPIGGAGLIVVYEHKHADVIEAAVTRAIKKAIGDRHKASALAKLRQMAAGGA